MKKRKVRVERVPKVGEPYVCVECGKVHIEKMTAMDVFGYHFVDGLCPACVKTSTTERAEKVRETIERIWKGEGK